MSPSQTQSQPKRTWQSEQSVTEDEKADQDDAIQDASKEHEVNTSGLKRAVGKSVQLSAAFVKGAFFTVLLHKPKMKYRMSYLLLHSLVKKVPFSFQSILK